MVAHEITVITPTIGPRSRKMLPRAIESVKSQTLLPIEHLIEEDTEREGPAVVRNRALTKVKTDWIAFLDDDDYLLPEHLETLARAQSDTGADVVWPWFRVEGGGDPFPAFYGRQWNPDDPHQVPITALLRTEAVRAVGGFTTVPPGSKHADGNRAGEDWELWLALSAAGYRFHHVKKRTWVWCHHGRNTSGLPHRW
jgi:glycosyltransferase involved in cell wall biosynthesis